MNALSSPSLISHLLILLRFFLFGRDAKKWMQYLSYVGYYRCVHDVMSEDQNSIGFFFGTIWKGKTMCNRERVHALSKLISIALKCLIPSPQARGVQMGSLQVQNFGSKGEVALLLPKFWTPGEPGVLHARWCMQYWYTGPDSGL